MNLFIQSSRLKERYIRDTMAREHEPDVQNWRYRVIGAHLFKANFDTAYWN